MRLWRLGSLFDLGRPPSLPSQSYSCSKNLSRQAVQTYRQGMSLDPDDPRPPYQQVASALRAAILTKKLGPGDRLPSGNELAKRYGVARMTVQQAFRLLRDEGLIVPRQGSGVFVRERTERPVGLRPHLERAFDDDKVTIDFAGFSGETLYGALGEPLDKVRAGR